MRFSMKSTLAASLALALSSVALGQNLGRAGGTTTGGTGSGFFPNPLYRMNDVSKSLNLTPDQMGRLNKATDGLQSRYRADVDKLGTLNQRERDTQTQQLQQRYNGDWMKSAQDVFNENQMNRYRQLDMQYRGFGAFSDADLQKRLNLTAEQQAQIREGNTWSQQQMQDINKRGTADRDEGGRLYQSYQQDYQKRLNKILTPEQQKSWQEMTGESYRFQPAFITPRR